MATDPVCGMFVEERPESLHLFRDNRTYYFCSETCRDQFADPARAQRDLGRRIAVAWPLALAVVVLTYAVGSRDAWALAAALATVVQFYPGAVFYRGARDAIADRSWNMDLLIAVGSSAAYGYSLAALLLPGRGLPGSYFDASALIVTLILTGNYLEHRTRARAGSALARLRDLLPSTATRIEAGAEHTIDVTEVRPGDRLRIRPGGRFPVDGVVREGRTTVDESLLTGESLPVARAPGERVVAGALNLDGLVDVAAVAVGTDTFAAQVGRLLSDAEMSRVPLQRTADRIAAVFVPCVLVLGVAAGLGWAVLGRAGPTVGLLVFVSVVIIACPCAFGLATPAAIVVGSGRAAEEGVLFRGEDALERAARVDLVLTDKTGTLTEGKPTLVEVRPLGGRADADALALAAAVESGSEHPLARAVEDAARARSLPIPAAVGVRSEPGVGVRGEVAGSLVEVRRLDASAQGEGSGPVGEAASALASEGRSVAIVLKDGDPQGVLAFSDTLRPGAREAVAALGQDGIRTVIATGDGPAAAAAIAREAAITEAHALLTPAGKLALLRSLQTAGHRVAFVGDGINDAPALAAADLGIAIGSGTDVAKEAGQVVLVRSDFGGVALALRLARRTVAKVRSNFAWAIGYNAVLLPIAAGALVPALGFGVYAVLPIAGAVAMALSSTLVVANSLSLRWVTIGTPRPAVP